MSIEHVLQSNHEIELRFQFVNAKIKDDFSLVIADEQKRES